MFLLDVNVWLALAFDSHVHHSAAKNWYNATSETCYFCRWTQQGFLRLATNPVVFKEEAVSLKQAWRMYDRMVSDPRIAFAEEPQDIETRWREYTQRRSFSPKVWSDAYLAAFARAAGFELVSFDQGFKQYRNLRHITLG
jgi:toxin-antitoxin system PIN domain toxin